MRTLFAAAAALSATTILTGTIAAAAPMDPQAPADCQSYKFTGMGTIIEDKGPDLYTGWGPDGRSGAVNTRDGFTAPNRPDMSVPEGTPMNGTIRGGIDGHNVEFAVTWDEPEASLARPTRSMARSTARPTSGVSWRAGKN